MRRASHRNWILLKNPGHFERESEMTGDSSTHLSLTSPKNIKTRLPQNKRVPIFSLYLVVTYLFESATMFCKILHLSLFDEVYVRNFQQSLVYHALFYEYPTACLNVLSELIDPLYVYQNGEYQLREDTTLS